MSQPACQWVCTCCGVHLGTCAAAVEGGMEWWNGMEWNGMEWWNGIGMAGVRSAGASQQTGCLLDSAQRVPCLSILTLWTQYGQTLFTITRT